MASAGSQSHTPAPRGSATPPRQNTPRPRNTSSSPSDLFSFLDEEPIQNTGTPKRPRAASSVVQSPPSTGKTRTPERRKAKRQRQKETAKAKNARRTNEDGDSSSPSSLSDAPSERRGTLDVAPPADPPDSEDDLDEEPITKRFRMPTRRPTDAELDLICAPPTSNGIHAASNYALRLQHYGALVKRFQIKGYAKQDGYVKPRAEKPSSGEVTPKEMKRRMNAAVVKLDLEEFTLAIAHLAKYNHKLRKYGWSGSTWNRSALPSLKAKEYKEAEERLHTLMPEHLIRCSHCGRYTHGILCKCCGRTTVCLDDGKGCADGIAVGHLYQTNPKFAFKCIPCLRKEGVKEIPNYFNPRAAEVLFNVGLPRVLTSILIRTPKVDSPEERVFLAPVKNTMSGIADQYLVDVVLDARNPHEMDEVRQKIRETMKSTSTVLVVTVEVHSNDHRMYVAKGKKTLDMRTLLDMFLGTELMNDFFEYPGKKMLWIATCSAPDMAEARLYEWGNLITMGYFDFVTAFSTDDAHFPDMRAVEMAFLEAWFVRGMFPRQAMLSAQRETASRTRIEPVLIEPRGNFDNPTGRIFFHSGNDLEHYTAALRSADGHLANSCPSCHVQLTPSKFTKKYPGGGKAIRDFRVPGRITCFNKSCPNPFTATPAEREMPAWMSFNGHSGPPKGKEEHRLLWDAPFPLPRLYRARVDTEAHDADDEGEDAA